MDELATVEDLSIDDSLGIVERVLRYATSNIALQRLVHVKMLTETVEAAGFDETVNSLVPLIRTLTCDSEWVVRQNLGEQLGGVAQYCLNHGGDPGYRLLIEVLLPLFAKLLGDRQEEVRLSTGESLCSISKLMRPEDRGKHILTIVLQLAHDDEQEELRMTAAKLLNDLAESLGQELCKQFVSPELVSLAEDPVFRVRKVAALSMNLVCQVAGDQDTMERLLPAFIRLTRDDIYRVRKACAEILVDISKAVSSDLRSHVLLEVFNRLANDTSKFVRNTALQQLGPFIATLKTEEVSPELLRLFTDMASPSSGDSAVDNDIRLYCAFNFPAVVYTVGTDRWGEVREAFQLLVKDVQWNIRRTLSYSLHELARILADSDRVEAELLFAFDLFLKDVDDVRSGVLQHIGEFLKYVSPATRENYLPVLCDMVSRTTPTNWRPREILAHQLPELLGLFSPLSTHMVIAPLCFNLLEDAVAMVRERAYAGFGPLIDRFGDEHAEWRDAVLQRLLNLAHSESSFKRQMFLHVAAHLARSSGSGDGSGLTHESYISTVLPPLARMAWDPVVLLRISFARNLSDYPDWVLHHPSMVAALEAMDHEDTKDVRHFMGVFKHRRPIVAETLGVGLGQLEVMPLSAATSRVDSKEEGDGEVMVKLGGGGGGDDGGGDHGDTDLPPPEGPVAVMPPPVHGAGDSPITTQEKEGPEPPPENGIVGEAGGEGTAESLEEEASDHSSHRQEGEEVKPDDVIMEQEHEPVEMSPTDEAVT